MSDCFTIAFSFYVCAVNRYYSYLNSAKEIIATYTGAEPLSSYLKKFFSAQKKYGSKDRKQIAHLCYCYFRLGKMATDMAIDDRIIAGLFLCSESPNEVLELLKPEWNLLAANELADKLSAINGNYNVGDIFPWQQELTGGIHYESFCLSFFVQPDLFLRLRPGFENGVKENLANSGITFTTIYSNCIALSNASKIDSIIELDKEAIVQDRNSQRTGELMQHAVENLSSPINVWDCCAASGGKSILLYDLLPAIRLTVSDVRESILENLKKRFAKAAITRYKSFIADLSRPGKNEHVGLYDLIIADVPCSGSGTWGRTPEQLFYFTTPEIDRYSELQRKIITTAIRSLKPGGYLLYITCSVFKRENEEVIDYIKENFLLEIKQVSIFKGYAEKADTLFAALLYKPL